MEESEVLITLSKPGVATVWNKSDVIKLKKDLRIPGTLQGSLPRKPWQNQVMSLPLFLMPEEVSLLIQKGLAVLKCKEMGVYPPEEGIIEMLKHLRKKSHNDQMKIFVKERKIKKQIFSGKRKRVNFTDGKKCSNLPEAPDMSNIMTESKCRLEVNSLKDKEPDATPSPNCQTSQENAQNVATHDMQYYSKSTCIHVPTTYPNGSALSQAICDNATVGKWSYPVIFKDKCRYAVYCNLWGKGYYITSGAKFGCDYLAYPGEPTKYHSHFIVIVMPSKMSCSPHQLLAYGRLASAVKKTVVFAIVNDNDFIVKFQSISWTSME